MLNSNFVVSKIYHSREDRISELHSETDRIDYSNKDIDRIGELVSVVDEYNDKFLDKLEKHEHLITDSFEKVTQDWDESEVVYSRKEVIERWALAQAALSKAAWVLRFDGNKAYERMINALKTGAAADMRGL